MSEAKSYAAPVKIGDVITGGTFHKPSSDGASILMFEQTGTNSTGDEYEGSLPDNIESTTGHLLD